MRKFARENLKHYLMILPFFLFFLVFFLYPIGKGFYISFFKWDAVHIPEYVGLKNYQSVITSTAFIKSFTNLFKYVFITVPVGITVAFILALIVNSFKGFWSGLFRSVYFLPVMVPMFLAASIWRWMYMPEVGIINTALSWVGISSIDFLHNPKWMIYSLIVVDVWLSMGFNMVILLAGLKNIPTEYYDAGKVDGANKIQEVFYITIPQLWPALFFTITYGYIAALQVFDAPWLITASANDSYGGRQNSLLFPVMDMMGRAFGSLKFGPAAAYGFLLLITILIVTIILFVFQRKVNRSVR